jgi:ubiquinone/menaquinone biosynthesis C-methylase UbiE
MTFSQHLPNGIAFIEWMKALMGRRPWPACGTVIVATNVIKEKGATAECHGVDESAKMAPHSTNSVGTHGHIGWTL